MPGRVNWLLLRQNRNDLFIAAEHFTQQIVCHEIGHAFGVVFEGDRYVDGVVQGYATSTRRRGPSCVLHIWPSSVGSTAPTTRSNARPTMRRATC